MSKAWERLDMELATLSDSYDDKMVIFLSLLLEPIWLQLFKDKNPALQAEKKVDKSRLTSRTVATSHEIILSVVTWDSGNVWSHETRDKANSGSVDVLDKLN